MPSLANRFFVNARALPKFSAATRALSTITPVNVTQTGLQNNAISETRFSLPAASSSALAGAKPFFKQPQQADGGEELRELLEAAAVELPQIKIRLRNDLIRETCFGFSSACSYAEIVFKRAATHVFLKELDKTKDINALLKLLATDLAKRTIGATNKHFTWMGKEAPQQKLAALIRITKASVGDARLTEELSASVVSPHAR